MNLKNKRKLRRYYQLTNIPTQEKSNYTNTDVKRNKVKINLSRIKYVMRYE